MTASTTTHPTPKKQAVRPTLLRIVASKYVDLLFAGFMAWLVCFAFGWRASWPTAAVFLWVAETFWCRDRLHPTAGEFCLGIRYLTSASSQVVADIQVLHPKLKLNRFLVGAGVLEITLAVLLFSGWTFFGRSALLGWVLDPPFSMVYWALLGLGTFTCGGLILGGSRAAQWAVPLFHFAMTLDLYRSGNVWAGILQRDLLSTQWAGRPVILPFPLWEGAAAWGIVLFLGLILSRKQLQN